MMGWEVMGGSWVVGGILMGTFQESAQDLIHAHRWLKLLLLANIWFNVSILQFKLLNIQIWLTAAVEISISTPLLSPIQFGILWEKFNFRSDKTFNWNFLNKITNLAVLFNKSFSIDWLIEVYLDMYTVNTIDLSKSGDKFMRNYVSIFVWAL